MTGVAVMATGLLAVPAQADSWVRAGLQNVGTRQCLDARVESDGWGYLYTLGCTYRGNRNQQWELHYRDPQGYHTIRNLATDQCVTAGIEDRGFVTMRDCDEGFYGDRQRWVKSGDRRMNRATSLCLDATSAGTLYMASCSASTHQKWIVHQLG